MRILHFCESFSPLSETFIYDLIMELERQGADNQVLTFERMNSERRPFPKVAVVPQTPRFHPSRICRRLLAKAGMGAAEEAGWPAERRRLLAQVDEIKPDLIHAHFGPAGVKMAPVAFGRGIPLVVSFHAYEITRLAQSAFWRTQYRELWPMAARLSGVSEYICSRLRALGAPSDKVIHMSNGVKLDEFPCQNPAERFDGKTVECLFVGRLVEKKGPLLLVKSFQIARQLAGNGLDLVLHIVGDGPLRPAVEDYCRQEKLEDAVCLHGPKSHAEVKAMLRRAHIYVQHSVTAADGDQEGQPVSLIEAAASGLSIVSTRHSGIPEIVLDGKSGFLVEETDFEDMGRKIVQLATDRALWRTFGQNGHAHIEAKMNQERQAAIWRTLYENVLASGPVRPVPSPAC